METVGQETVGQVLCFRENSKHNTCPTVSHCFPLFLTPVPLFRDGNERTARLMVNGILVNDGYGVFNNDKTG